MMAKYSRRTVLLATVIAALGCGGSGLPETVSVTGTVTYQGNPVTDAQVVLNSTDPKGKPATGATDAQGKFTVQTYVSPTAQAKGAIPGQYKVTVTKIEQSKQSSEEMMKAASSGQPAMPKNLLPKKYSVESSTDLTADVKKGMGPLSFALTD
ncbi:MAG: carboxypeptidase-like regulatory domain-containing protein [Planctomycetota bacterium]